MSEPGPTAAAPDAGKLRSKMDTLTSFNAPVPQKFELGVSPGAPSPVSARTSTEPEVCPSPQAVTLDDIRGSSLAASAQSIANLSELSMQEVAQYIHGLQQHNQALSTAIEASLAREEALAAEVAHREESAPQQSPQYAFATKGAAVRCAGDPDRSQPPRPTMANLVRTMNDAACIAKVLAQAGTLDADEADFARVKKAFKTLSGVFSPPDANTSASRLDRLEGLVERLIDRVAETSAAAKHEEIVHRQTQQSAGVEADRTQLQPAPSSAGWSREIDPASGHAYWFNATTNESRWEDADEADTSQWQYAQDEDETRLLQSSATGVKAEFAFDLDGSAPAPRVRPARVAERQIPRARGTGALSKFLAGARRALDDEASPDRSRHPQHSASLRVSSSSSSDESRSEHASGARRRSGQDHRHPKQQKGARVSRRHAREEQTPVEHGRLSASTSGTFHTPQASLDSTRTTELSWGEGSVRSAFPTDDFEEKGRPRHQPQSAPWPHSAPGSGSDASSQDNDSGPSSQRRRAKARELRVQKTVPSRRRQRQRRHTHSRRRAERASPPSSESSPP